MSDEEKVNQWDEIIFEIELCEAVKKMREAQRNYFHDPCADNLRAARHAESAVDTLLYEHNQGQKKLF